MASVATSLASATHVVLTTGGNDLGLGPSIQQIIVDNNYGVVANRAISLKSGLVATYEIIQKAVHPGIKIYALRYVDIFGVGNKVPNEALSPIDRFIIKTQLKLLQKKLALATSNLPNQHLLVMKCFPMIYIPVD